MAVDPFVGLSDRLDKVDWTDLFGNRTRQLQQIRTDAMVEIKARLESTIPSSSVQIELEKAFFKKFQQKTKGSCIVDAANALKTDLTVYTAVAKNRKAAWEKYVVDRLATPNQVFNDYADRSPKNSEKTQLLDQIRNVQAAAQSALFSVNPENYSKDRSTLHQVVLSAAKLTQEINANEAMYDSAGKVQQLCTDRGKRMRGEEADQVELADWKSKTPIKRLKQDPSRALTDVYRDNPQAVQGAGLGIATGVAAKVVFGLAASQAIVLAAAVCGAYYFLSHKKTA